MCRQTLLAVTDVAPCSPPSYTGQNGFRSTNSLRYFVSWWKGKKKSIISQCFERVLKEWSSCVYSHMGSTWRLHYVTCSVAHMKTYFLNAWFMHSSEWMLGSDVGQIQFHLSCACTLTHKNLDNVTSLDLEKSLSLMKLQFGPGCAHMHA